MGWGNITGFFRLCILSAMSDPDLLSLVCIWLVARMVIVYNIMKAVAFCFVIYLSFVACDNEECRLKRIRRTSAGVALVALSGIKSAGLGPAGLHLRNENDFLICICPGGDEVMTDQCGAGCCCMGGRCCQMVPRRGMKVCPSNPRGCKACT